MFFSWPPVGLSAFGEGRTIIGEPESTEYPLNGSPRITISADNEIRGRASRERPDAPKTGSSFRMLGDFPRPKENLLGYLLDVVHAVTLRKSSMPSKRGLSPHAE